MIKNFVKILKLLGDRLEVCVSVDKGDLSMLKENNFENYFIKKKGFCHCREEGTRPYGGRINLALVISTFFVYFAKFTKFVFRSFSLFEVCCLRVVRS